MLLTDILTPQRIRPALAGTTKEAVIEELLDLIAADGLLTDRDRALAAILERERTRTTGIGSGLALPHGKSSGASTLAMAIGKCPAGVDFQAIDGKPVTLVMLLVSPMDKTGPHIQALARISRMMSIDAFRNKLAAAATAKEMYQLIQVNESKE